MDAGIIKWESLCLLLLVLVIFLFTLRYVLVMSLVIYISPNPLQVASYWVWLTGHAAERLVGRSKRKQGHWFPFLSASGDDSRRGCIFPLVSDSNSEPVASVLNPAVYSPAALALEPWPYPLLAFFLKPTGSSCFPQMLISGPLHYPLLDFSTLSTFL